MEGDSVDRVGWIAGADQSSSVAVREVVAVNNRPTQTDLITQVRRSGAWNRASGSEQSKLFKVSKVIALRGCSGWYLPKDRPVALQLKERAHAQ